MSHNGRPEIDWVEHAEFLIKRGYPTIIKDPQELGRILKEKAEKSEKHIVNNSDNIEKP
jgi:hypothetical protein